MARLVMLAFLSVYLPLLFLGVVHGGRITSCSQTPYPGICNSFVRTQPQATLDKTQFAFRESNLRVTLNQAEKAYRLVSAMDLRPFNKQAKLAWADCLELYEDTVSLLNQSLSSHSTPTGMADAQTWLSAAMTNHQTCQNGFIEFNLTSHLQFFPFMLSSLSKLLSNSLAVNKVAALSVKQRHNRRLLANGFPGWVSAADRKLLQSSGAASYDVVVAQDGTGDYTTISEAVSASATLRTGTDRFVIYVKAGIYRENVMIEKSMKNLMVIGDGIGSTIVTGNTNSNGATTFRTATFAVWGNNFIARDMTVKNTAGPENYQAVALRSGSDFSVFYRCSFIGYQDTLYAYSQRQFYRDCEIYGTIDFIFGNAVTVLQNCNIFVRKPLSNQKNTITAQGRTDPNQNTGIVVHNSRVTAASDLKPVQSSFKSYLGRPYKMYSRTVFMKSSLDSLIDPAGWLPFNGDFALSTLYYGEYMNTGAGAGTSGRVTWPGYHVITSATEAAKFTVGNFLDGDSWIPGTGVPFSSTL
ncbi:pectinesterase-like [Cornus florida]|uniref:pectinesterase-like n=1 Tax=Cornus florida TaxID=4283 RepID=UPI00289A3B7B|nr:pectinesterase-like [Cornus florida]